MSVGQKKSGCAVTLWYDGQYVLDLENKGLNQKLNGITFKNIRDLQWVKDHEELFTQDQPLYWRIDLLKQIVTVETLEEKTIPSICVMTDFSVPPLSWEELIDTETIQNLKKKGIVMAYSNDSLFENGFQMTSNTCKQLLETLRNEVIEASLELYSLSKKMKNTLHPEMIFTLLPNALRLSAVLAGNLRLTQNDVSYNDADKEQKELMRKILRNIQINNGKIFQENLGLMVRSIPLFEGELSDWLATKDVCLPVAQSYYT